MSPMFAWRQFYEQALVETDLSRLPVLIQAARAAIDRRIEQLPSDSPVSSEERQAIADALAGLRVLKQESDLN